MREPTLGELDIAAIADGLQALHQDEVGGFADLIAVTAQCGLGSRDVGAVCNADAWWLVALGANGDLDDPSSFAVAVSESAQLVVGRWDEVRLAEGLILQHGVCLIGDLWLRWLEGGMLPPFHLDPVSWTGAVCGGDDPTFVVEHERCEYSFDASGHGLWGPGAPGVRVGTWVSMVGEYAGAWVSSDAQGCVWGEVSEAGAVLLGRPDREPPVTVETFLGVLDVLFAGGQFEVASLTSDFLTSAELEEYAGVVAGIDPNYDPALLAIAGRVGE